MRKETMRLLLETIRGVTPPDCVIRNGRILNVFTNEIEEGRAVVIKEGFIVNVEEDTGDYDPDKTRIIDAEGSYLSPGFIDAHTHIDSMYTFHGLVPYALRGGTTTVVTECAMAACTCGLEGVMSFIESTRGYPLRCRFLAPPLTPPFPQMEGVIGLTLKEFSRLLKREDFVGIGEGYWTRIVEADDRVLGQAQRALALNKRLDGHSAGARGRRLSEYLLTGITSCHESTTVDELMEKLRQGVYIMIRDGFVRRELPVLSAIKDMKVDMRRIMIVSDVFDAVMLLNEGYLDSLVRKAIGYGFDPIEAYKMVTINPADYYGLRYLGAIAPLRHADILFIGDLEKVRVDKVMSDGIMAYENGNVTVRIDPYAYGDDMRNTIRMEYLKDEDFRIKAKDGKTKIRIIDVVNETITREVLYDARINNGFVEKDVENDILPVSVINRKKSGQHGKGFIRGTGIRDGAFATTLIWDTGNMLVIGTDETDMRVAANRLAEIQGGIVIAQGGSVIYEFPMPVFGLIPEGSIEELSRKTLELEEKMELIGTVLKRPFLTLQTVSFTGLPFLRITDKGLADIKNKRLVSLFV